MKKHNQKKESNIGRNVIISIAALIVIAVTAMAITNMMKGGEAKELDSGANQVNQEGRQVVKVKVVGSNYVMDPPEIRMGVPTSLEFDMNTVVGCSRTVVLPEFSVRKTLSASDNTINFTPLKTGNFRIACSMNMYTGSFKVV